MRKIQVNGNEMCPEGRVFILLLRDRSLTTWRGGGGVLQKGGGGGGASEVLPIRNGGHNKF